MSIRQLNVVPATVVVRNAAGKREHVECGFHVTALASWDMGETYEHMAHPAIFQTKAAAERFLQRIRATLRVDRPANLDHWIIAESHQVTYYVRRREGEFNPGFYSVI